MQMKQWVKGKTSVVCHTEVAYKYTDPWHAPAILITAIREN